MRRRKVGVKAGTECKTRLKRHGRSRCRKVKVDGSTMVACREPDGASSFATRARRPSDSNSLDEIVAREA